MIIITLRLFAGDDKTASLVSNEPEPEWWEFVFFMKDVVEFNRSDEHVTITTITGRHTIAIEYDTFFKMFTEFHSDTKTKKVASQKVLNKLYN